VVSGDSSDVWSNRGLFRLDMRVVRRRIRSRRRARTGLAALRLARHGAHRVSLDAKSGQSGGRDVWAFPGGPRHRDVSHVLPVRRRPQVGFLALGRGCPDPPRRNPALHHRGFGQVVAEDLGALPEFLRPSLARLGLPGYRFCAGRRPMCARRQEGNPAARPGGLARDLGGHLGHA